MAGQQDRMPMCLSLPCFQEWQARRGVVSVTAGGLGSVCVTV